MGPQSGFPRGRIIPLDDVIGRRGFLIQLEERLYYGDSVMLAGPRRIGKSSAAFKVLRGLEERGCYTIDLDLLHIVNTEQFAIQVLKKVMQLRTGVMHHAIRSLQDFLRWIEKPELSVKVQDIEFGLRMPSEVDRTVEPTAILQEAFELAGRIAKRDKKRIVFLLDEFQEVDRIGGEPLIKLLRSIFQQQDSVTYLFLGSEPSMLKTIFADRRQAFYRFATMLQLPDIDRDEWSQYARHKLFQFEMSIDDVALDYVLDVTGSHPYCVMAVLSNVFLEAKKIGTTKISSELAIESVRQTFEQLDAVYEDLWKRALETPLGDEVLIAISDGNPPYQGKNSTAARRAIDALIKNSIIMRTGRGQYTFIEPMFHQWITHNISE